LAAGSASADYCINKDLINLGPPANDFAVQIPAQPVTFHYDGGGSYVFNSFSVTPAGASQILHWQNLNGGGVIPTGTPTDPWNSQVHVGWCTPTEHAMENMYWTDASGAQIPDSIVLQVGGHTSNSPVPGVQWDNVTNHSFTVNQVWYAVSNTDWHLADLNGNNQVLARQLRPLPGGTSFTLSPGKSIKLSVPGATAGQSIVLRYEVTGPESKARVRDFVQFRLRTTTGTAAKN
jgi:hypothetical protein